MAAIMSLIASQASAAAVDNWVLRIDDSTSDLHTYVYLNGSLYQPVGDCHTVASNENCSQAAGFYAKSPSAATTFTTNFVVFESDGVTVSDFGTATAEYVADGGLQDFGLSLNSGSTAFPLGNPFNPGDYLSFIETGGWQTAASFSAVDSQGVLNNVSLQFRSDDVSVPEPLTISLFGAGLAGAVAMRRRKKAMGA